MKPGRRVWFAGAFSIILGLGFAAFLMFGMVRQARSAETVASLSLTKTVGTDPGVCANTNSVTVGSESMVYYCYEVVNTGNEALLQHTLVDDHAGLILSNFPYNLLPSASAFITQAVQVTASVNAMAEWTGKTAANVLAKGTDDAEVIVIPPSLDLQKTVGTDKSVCAPTDVVNVVTNTPVTYCFEVTNTGQTNLVLHTLTDGHSGSVLNNFPYVLTPGASAFITDTVVATASINAMATWEGETPGGENVIDRDSAQVNVIYKSYLPGIRKN